MFVEALGHHVIGCYDDRHNDSRVHLPHTDNLVHYVKIFYLFLLLSFNKVLVMWDGNMGVPRFWARMGRLLCLRLRLYGRE